MSDAELKQVKKLNSTLKIFWTLIAANIVTIFFAVWFISDMNRRVTTLEKNQIEIRELVKDKVGCDDMAYVYNNYYTTYMWAVMWGLDLPEPPYNIRGKVPNL